MKLGDKFTIIGNGNRYSETEVHHYFENGAIVKCIVDGESAYDYNGVVVVEVEALEGGLHQKVEPHHLRNYRDFQSPNFKATHVVLGNRKPPIHYFFEGEEVEMTTAPVTDFSRRAYRNKEGLVQYISCTDIQPI